MTAAEAYPALEKAFLDARSEVWASFTTFDLETPLRSDRARAIGATWHDLLVATLKRGVALNIMIADGDPVLHQDLHQGATRQLRLLQQAAAEAGEAGCLRAISLRHPVRSNLATRLIAWPFVQARLHRMGQTLNALGPGDRAQRLSELGDLAHFFRPSANGAVRARLFKLPLLGPAIHHQKLAVIDQRQLYIGGIDLDSRHFQPLAGGRSGNRTWHDLQLILEGPVVAEAQLHLESFQSVVSGKTQPYKTRRLIRTLSVPRGKPIWSRCATTVAAELRSAHVALVQRSKSLIYIETQYFEDEKLAERLADRARRNPQLSAIVMLPALPDYRGLLPRWLGRTQRRFLQNRALSILRDNFGERLFVGSATQCGNEIEPGAAGIPGQDSRQPGSRQARLAIFDDDAALISSADLTWRSLALNTEAGLYLANAGDVRELRYRVMTHWLPPATSEDAFEPATAVHHWKRIAAENAALSPDLRRGRILPHAHAAAEAMRRISAR